MTSFFSNFFIPVVLGLLFTHGVIHTLSLIFPQKIKIAIRHAGNQSIPEFYKKNGQSKKTLYFTLNKNQTIYDLKKTVAKTIKHTCTNSIKFMTSPLGIYLTDKINLSDIENIMEPFRWKNRQGESIRLFIVIPGY